MSHIIVAGALANKMNHGGEAWVRLSWLKGFAKLGYNVHFVEQIAARQCHNGSENSAEMSADVSIPFANSLPAKYFQKTMADAGFGERSTLICADTGESIGLPINDLADLISQSELLVNISGHLAIPQLFNAARRKAYVDIDPGFTQFWYADNMGSNLDGHDSYFTIGENIGSTTCDIPSQTPGNKPWIITRQPVVLEDWPMCYSNPSPLHFTTIASWRGPFGTVKRNGKTYGLKCHEFRKIISLPVDSQHEFELALNIHTADEKDRNLLLANRWQLTDPLTAGSSPELFREYVQDSDAEFSVAQGIYVDSNSGWFSDRSVRYLASGKPVIVQDTGFASHLPTGEGLLGFTTLEQAREAVDVLANNYEHHARSARKIAETHFDSNVILRRFLENAM